MDPTRFDALSRTLGRLRSRRGLARVVGGSALAAALGLLGAADPAAAGCAKKCGPCKRCKHGKCKPKPNDTPCQGNGRCLKGRCNRLPGCTPAGQGCSSGNPGVCCSGVCGLGQSPTCVRGDTGATCLAGGDCISGECIGYRCQGEVDCATKQNGTLCETNRACHDGACVACWTEANDGCGVVRSGTVIINRPAFCFGDQCYSCTSDLWCFDRCLASSACRNHCGKSCSSPADCCSELTCQEEGGPGGPKHCLPPN